MPDPRFVDENQAVPNYRRSQTAYMQRQKPVYENGWKEYWASHCSTFAGDISGLNVTGKLIIHRSAQSSVSWQSIHGAVAAWRRKSLWLVVRGNTLSVCSCDLFWLIQNI
jgi:hypothetical protein